MKESPKSLGLIPSRSVLRNVTKEQALQINGPIGEKGWMEVFQLEIRDNEATGNGIQVNHAISEDAFRQLLLQNHQNEANIGISIDPQVIEGLVFGLVLALAVWLR